jgi:uncharacterized protein (TIGR02452 family)
MSGDAYVTIAEENEAIVRAGGYTPPGGEWIALGALLAASRGGTRSYSPEETAGLVEAARGEAVVGDRAGRTEVTAESSIQAARRLIDSGADSVGVLNFASARNPGGGYLRGSRAQEEDLCRVSALHTTLLEAPEYYAAHRAVKDPFYSHRVVYSPDVPVYRDDHYALVGRPVLVSFLTSPAPNAGIVARECPERLVDVPAVLAERAARVLAVAASHGRRELVLGAWGCGVFRNDPAMVAEAFRVLFGAGGLFEGRFARVVFAVLDKAPTSPNLSAFRDAFSGV